MARAISIRSGQAVSTQHNTKGEPAASVLFISHAIGATVTGACDFGFRILSGFRFRFLHMIVCQLTAKGIRPPAILRFERKTALRLSQATQPLFPI